MAAHLLALGHSIEALRQLDTLIAVAHPDILHIGGCVAIQLAALLYVHRHASILTTVRALFHLAAQAEHQQLHAIANSQNRDVLLRHVLQEARCQARRALHVHRVWTA